MLSVSLCAFFNPDFLTREVGREQFHVAEEKCAKKKRVGYVRIPGSNFFHIARF